MRRPLLFALALALAACAPRERAYDRAPPHVTLNGEGSSFAAPLYHAWGERYATVAPDTTVAYASTNSGAGVEAILAGHVAFGGSDPPLDPAKNKDSAIVELPMMLGAVVLGYHVDALSQSPPLKLTADVVARIYSGAITRWNDPAIVSVNDPKTPLPALPIRVFYRTGTSGTTTVFTDYLARTAGGSWTKNASIAVPNGNAAASNDEMTASIAGADGALGYVDYAYAAGHVKMAAMQNRAGRFVSPTLGTIAAAAAAARPAKLTDSLLDAPGEDSYPAPSFSFALVYRETKGRDSGVALARFLWWAAHDGQQMAPAKGYVTLPAEIVVRLEGLLHSLRAGGEPSLPE